MACNNVDNTTPPTGDDPTITYVPAATENSGNDGHIGYYTDGSKFYADEAGEQEFDWADDILIPATGEHTEATAWQSEGGKHWHNCSVCGKPATEKVSHTFSWVTDQDPEETGSGLQHEVCECGETRNIDTVVSYHAFVGATCGASGNEQYWERNGVKYSDKDFTQELDDIVIPATGEHTASDEWATGNGKHWHNCKDCNALIENTQAVHNYNVSVFVPGSNSANASLGGTFHKMCECGEDGGLAVSSAENAYYDRTVIINGVTYGAYTIYTDPDLQDKGVTFDAVLGGRFVIDASKFDSTTVIEGKNSDVSILVKDGVNATIQSIVGCDKNTSIDGNGVLTVTGNITMNASNKGILTVNEGVTFNVNGTTTLVSFTVNGGTVNMKGTLSVINFNVGNAENSSQPIVNIAVDSVVGLTNEVSWHGEAATYNILSGVVAIQQNGNGQNGITFTSRSGSTITVGEHATLTIKNFDTGISGPADSILNIYGTLKVLAVGKYAWHDWGETHHYAITGFSTTVAGTLELQSSAWGMGKGTVVFESGSKSVIIRTNTGNAVFHSMTSVTVNTGADLGIKGFDRVIYGNNPSTLEIADGILTVESIANIANDTLISSSMYNVGTVSPGSVEIENVLDEE